MAACAGMVLIFWVGAAVAAFPPRGSLASTQDLADAASSDPESASPFALACLADLSIGRLHDALNACDQAVQLNPADADTLRLSGGIRLLLGDPQPARVDIALAIERDPSNAQSYELAGKAAFALGDYAGAIQSFDAALLLAPRDANAFDGRGASWQAMRRYDAAERDFTRSITVARDQAWSWNARCWVRMLADKMLRAALSDCHHAAWLAPNEPHVRDSLGWVWLRLDDPARAIPSFDTALARNARLSSSFYGRSLARDELGDARGAAADIASARALEPGIAARFRSYGIHPVEHRDPRPVFASSS
jgi:tetratricopeptide (TPR) repeat protein